MKSSYSVCQAAAVSGFPSQFAASMSALGCNRNLFIGNDFSYSPAHGIEMTFSFGNQIWRNRFAGNAICGIWGGYTGPGTKTVIAENAKADIGSALAHPRTGRVEAHWAASSSSLGGGSSTLTLGSAAGSAGAVAERFGCPRRLVVPLASVRRERSTAVTQTQEIHQPGEPVEGTCVRGRGKPLRW